MPARINLHSTKSKQVSLILAVVALLAISTLIATWQQASPLAHSTLRSAPALDPLPLAFEPNAGQSDPVVRFVAHAANGSTLFFAPSEVVLSLPQATEDGLEGRGSQLTEGQGLAEGSVPKPQRPSAPVSNRQSKVVRLQFLGANDATTLISDKEMPGKVNYIAGADPAQWHTGVPTYAELAYSSLYPGVNLTYSGMGG